MIPRLLAFWDRIRSSLWALPLLMVGAASLLAYAALNIQLDIGGDSATWYLYSGSAKQAPQFLSNLVSAMITMATLAISITMVVLTLAAQQLGPRLIRSFMADKRTQVALGLFIATVVYLLLVLRRTYGLEDSTPNLAVTVGTALVLISVGTLLFFVHHLAQSIIADNVIDRVGEQLDENIARLLPDEDTVQPAAPADTAMRGAPVSLTAGGYVQAIDIDAIVDAAAEAEAFVALDIRAGQHTVPGCVVSHVSPAAAAERLTAAIRAAVLVGHERTAIQDLEFSVHQLVEVALRALSPGINDPFTAIAALDRLTLSLACVMKRGEALRVFQDADKRTRLVMPVSSFEGITDAAFNQIRQRSSGMPALLIRMAANIGQLLEQADAAQRVALEKHLTLVLRAGRRSIDDEADLNDLEQCARVANGAKPRAGTSEAHPGPER
ncbi:MAG: DUF2254 domain-containing protein [Pseudolabrys sp.]|nr:DUF2254 domain-containing protein [Pseudolabrys sp.]